MDCNCIVPTEHEEQVMLFRWAQLQSSKYPPFALMFAIPNGGKRNAKTAVDLKYEGVKSGVSDIFLPCACGGYHGLFVEMKRTRGGTIKILGRPKTTQKLAEEIGADYDVTHQGGLIMNDDNDVSRRMVEQCYRTTKTIVNPIIDWTDDDVWEFLRHYGCKSNPLYECGFKRIGCIGCPMAGRHRYIEFERYPVYKHNYIAAFDRMLKHREVLGKPANKGWETGLDVFRWWIGEDFRQITFDDLDLEEL